MAYKQFLIKYFILSFLLLILVGLFNRIVDPFWYYRDMEINGFNIIKPTFGNYERQIKPILLVREQPEAIILGSSYAEIGFDSSNKYFTNSGKLKSMNIALARAPQDEVQCNFEFAATHSNIKRALIGIHPSDMPKADCKKYENLGHVNLLELLFSISSLRDSIKTISKQKNEKISHTLDGRFLFNRNTPGVDIRFGEDFERYKQRNCAFVKSSISPFNTDFNEKVDYDGILNLIKISKEHNIELVLFFYPRHAYSLELDNECGAQNNIWKEMNKIIKFIESNSDQNQVRVWEFFGYNEITAEPVSSTATYWQDSMHFNYEMGEMMLNDMFSSVNPKKIGREINSKSIEADFQHFLKERTEFILFHPDLYEKIHFLKNICSNPKNKCNLNS